LSTFHYQFIMMAPTSTPREIGFRSEKEKLALDLQHHSGQDVQNQKDGLRARLDDPIYKVSDFRVRLKAAQAVVQQLVGRRVLEHERREGGTRCRDKSDVEAAD
jgi:hypothetical protein